ncbi:putative L-gulonolactone oxidase 1 [Silene latifolia]|uniref:putative L-gulonolactone oxidase 1 n=1 Tax=Silene latifolia TaxID=37657 RepID=UPI003D77EA2A
MSSRFWLSVITTYFVLWCQLVFCFVPEDIVKCSNGNSDCIVTNGYGSFPDRSLCRAADIVYPLNQDQLISYVRDATVAQRKIKVVTKYGHSFPKLVCPDGEDGLVISTKNLNKVLNFDVEQQTMTVQSGMVLKQLIDEAAKVGLALPHSPYWAGVTVGGMISTASHGSSLRGLGSAVHDYVVGLTIVSPGGRDDNFVKVRKLGVGDEDLKAAKVSLGVLGVISKVTFKLQPIFKRNLTFTTKSDKDLGDKALTFGHEHEFGDMVWLPSQRQVIYRIDDRVPVTTPGNGVYDFLPFRSIPQPILESVRASEDLYESHGLATLRCINSKTVTAAFLASAFGLTNNGFIFTGYPVIGYQNKMQSAGGCLEHHQLGYCAWDPRIDGEFYYSNGFTLPLSKVKSFIQDIQKLVNIKPNSLCGVEMYYGIIMRYVKKSPAYLGKDEDGIDFDITYYRSREHLSPRLYDDILSEIEQMAIFKYNGLPHWGKNRNVAFQGVINKYKDGNKFLDVKAKYDPLGLFSSEWTDQILGLKGGVTIKEVGCGREGLCICNNDTDCGPGYSCETGRVYTIAKVCRKNKIWNEVSAEENLSSE